MMQKRQPQLSQPPSKVLLVCVYDTIALEITNDLLHQKFQVYGQITKLLIFQKNEVTKFFIEYSEVGQALNAKAALDGYKLYGNICKMNIYFSNFRNVDLKNETTEGIDYSESEKETEYFLNRYDELTKASPEENSDDFNDLLMQSFDSPLARSKTDSPTTHSALMSCQEPLTESELDRSIQDNINELLESSPSAAVQKTKPPCSVIRLKEAVKTSSNVLFFCFFREVEVRNVYNLFSNFGNIDSIVKKNGEIYIKFRSLQFASISYSYLNNYRFMGNLLEFESPRTDMENIPKEREWCECISYDGSFDRFTERKSITINSPSNTLHVSSLRREICREETLHTIFSEFGAVEYVSILKQSTDKNMALVKFYRIEDSFGAISELHNRVYAGRKMQISFTKSRD